MDFRDPRVCRQWRQTALECATLWTYVSITRPLEVDAFLERSQRAPLVVMLNLVLPFEMDLSQERQRAITSIVKELPRIGDLCISTDLDQFVSAFGSFTLPSIDQLKELKLHFQEGMPAEQHAPLSILLTQIFGDVSVDVLSLSRCHVAYDASLLRGLTRLELNGPDEAYHPSFEEMHTILSSCSKLERLKLSQMGSKLTSTFPGRRFAPVQLAHLTYIWVYGLEARDWATLLSCLVLERELEGRRIHCYNFPLLLPVAIIPQQVSTTGALYIAMHPTVLAMRWSSDTEVSFTFDVEVLGSAGLYQIFTVASQLIEEGGMKSSSTFHLNIAISSLDSWTNEMAWNQLLGLLPDLLALTIGKELKTYHIERTLKTFTSSLTRVDAETSSPHICPKLKHLKLSYMQISRSLAQELGKLLEIRSLNHANIDLLTFEDCDINPEIVDYLKRWGTVEVTNTGVS